MKTPVFLFSFVLVSLLILQWVKSQNCTSAGRFRYSDVTCRSYYLCVLYLGAYVKSNYTCPSTMIFNPTTQTCSANATCIENACNGTGFARLPDPNNPTCTTYIQCIGVIPNRYPVLGTCPAGLYFNQGFADCFTTASCSTV